MKKHRLYPLLFLSLLVFAAVAEQQPIAPQQASPNEPNTSLPLIISKPSSPSSAIKAPEPRTPVQSSKVTTSGTLKDFLDIIETLFKIFAYILGGLWVYFNYFQGRTHKPRMEIKVTGGKLSEPFGGLVKIFVQAKNVGLSKIELKDEGTGIRIYVFDATKTVDNWIHVVTCSILTPYHQWIEPGETIEDAILIPVEPVSYAAIRAELNLNSTKVTWKVAAIL